VPRSIGAVVLPLLLLIQTAPPRFDAAKAWDHLRQLVALGPRPAGSPAIDQARVYIRSQLAAMHVPIIDQAWDDQTPVGTVHMVNLRATLPGTSRDRIVIAGHFDTKPERAFRFVGADDGGSSAAFLIELARALRGRPHRLTIELLFLDGEEAFVDWSGTDHTYGSRHYVDSAKQDGSLASLKALVLVDMIADRDLGIKREQHSTRWLTDIVWDTARQLKLESVFQPQTVAIEDDHLPFLAAGVPSLDIIDLEYEPWHTERDTLDAVSARSLQTVGDVLLASLPQIEAHLAPPRR
jgi:hypothetical protein